MTVKLTITSLDKIKGEQRHHFKYLRWGEILQIMLKDISDSTKVSDPELVCIIKNDNGTVYLTDRSEQGILINGKLETHCILHNGDQCLLPYSIQLSFGIYFLTGKDLFRGVRSSWNSIILEYIRPKAEKEETIDYSHPVGHEINGYYFEDVLSYGNMGIVYRGIQKSLNRKVAIKTVSPKNFNNQTLIKRFMNMASLAWRLNHPYIVQIYDTGMSREFQMHYVVMECIEGATLRDVLNEKKRLEIDYACKIMSQLASALAFAHRQHIIHRDVNPTNIIITKNDYIKLIGLALSKVLDPDQENIALTVKGQAMGTMGYISPEQAKSAADVDFRTDIYSLGVIFYECLTGRSPYDPEALKKPSLYVRALRSRPKVQPNKINTMIPANLNDIIMKCLEPNPDKRYQKVDHFLEDLKLYTEAAQYSTAQKRIRAMFPRTPISNVFDFHVVFEPMEEIGGDFYDYIPLDEEKWGIVIGDVTGHGVEAAVVMGMVKSIIKVMAKNLDTAVDVLEYANKEVSTDMDSTTFTTVNYGILDGNNMTIRFARAGHHPLIVFNLHRKASLVTYAPKGTVLGVPWSLNLEEVEIQLIPGDILVQFTDGITEIQSKQGEEYGIERLCNIISEQSGRTAEEISNAIRTDVSEFAKGMPDADDITLLVVKVREEIKNS
ncbi:MAG TPA: SpoIIE family protein phosphatase [Planctomycetota bacterium]|nr:SpoIIE family protein phosphatase [Planctomycetota bacterium]